MTKQNTDKPQPTGENILVELNHADMAGDSTVGRVWWHHGMADPHLVIFTYHGATTVRGTRALQALQGAIGQVLGEPLSAALPADYSELHQKALSLQAENQELRAEAKRLRDIMGEQVDAAKAKAAKKKGKKDEPAPEPAPDLTDGVTDVTPVIQAGLDANDANDPDIPKGPFLEAGTEIVCLVNPAYGILQETPAIVEKVAEKTIHGWGYQVTYTPDSKSSGSFLIPADGFKLVEKPGPGGEQPAPGAAAGAPLADGDPAILTGEAAETWEKQDDAHGGVGEIVYLVNDQGELISGNIIKVWDGSEKREVRLQKGGCLVRTVAQLRHIGDLVPEGKEAYDPEKHQPPTFVDESARKLTKDERKALIEAAEAAGITRESAQALIWEKYKCSSTADLTVAQRDELLAVHFKAPTKTDDGVPW